MTWKKKKFAAAEEMAEHRRLQAEVARQDVLRRFPWLGRPGQDHGPGVVTSGFGVSLAVTPSPAPTETPEPASTQEFPVEELSRVEVPEIPLDVPLPPPPGSSPPHPPSLHPPTSYPLSPTPTTEKETGNSSRPSKNTKKSKTKGKNVNPVLASTTTPRVKAKTSKQPKETPAILPPPPLPQESDTALKE